MTSFRSRSRPANTYDLLPPERPKPRAIPERMGRPTDAEDAEFVVIREFGTRSEQRSANPVNRARRPGNDNGRTRRPAEPTAFRVSPVAKTRLGSAVIAAERLLGRLSVNLFSALIAVCFIAVFGLCGGFSALAGTGTSAPRDPVAFTHVTVSPRTVNGIPMMIVNGILENHGKLPLVSPRLRANVRSGSYMLSSTLFNPRIGRIETGESRGFQIKLPHGGGKTPEVELSLAE